MLLVRSDSELSKGRPPRRCQFSFMRCSHTHMYYLGGRVSDRRRRYDVDEVRRRRVVKIKDGSARQRLARDKREGLPRKVSVGRGPGPRGEEGKGRVSKPTGCRIHHWQVFTVTDVDWLSGMGSNATTRRTHSNLDSKRSSHRHTISIVVHSVQYLALPA